MAQEDDLELDADGGKASKPKSNSKLIIIISAVVVLLSVSVTATLLLTGMLSDDQQAMAADGADGGKAGKQEKKAKAPLNYVPMDPPFVVNFNADTDIRFLQITVEVGTRDPEVVDLIKEHRPAIRNSLVMLFGNQDPHTLNTREGKEQLRDETLAEIQKVMQDETGDPGVENVFFTSFVMQ